MKRKEILFLICISLFGFFIRIYRITDSPEGLYVDETSIGYNAYSIVTTGKDEHGVFLPLFFEAFGEWKLPVYIYSVAYVQLFLGPTDLSVRLPAVLFGTLTVLLMFFWVRELLKEKYPDLIPAVPLISALFLAISPWHFQFTHAGFEASAAVLFLAAGLYLFFKAANTRSAGNLIFAGVAFVATLYSYNSSRIVTPLICLVLLIFYGKKFSFKTWILVLAINIILAWPFLQYAMSSAGMARAAQISIIYKPEYRSNLLVLLVKNYLANLSPKYWFIAGDPTIGHSTPFRMGLHQLVSMPFFYFGLGWLLIKRKKELYLPVFIILFGLIPPAVTTLGPHALRGVMIPLGTSLIIAIGFLVFINLIKIKYLRILTVLIFSTVLIINEIKFLDIYHNQYVPSAYSDWQMQSKIAAVEINKLAGKYQSIYIPDGPSVLWLWNLRIDPDIYLLAPDKTKLGKYYFNVRPQLLTVSRDKLVLSEETVLNGRLIQKITLPNGQEVYKLWLL